MPTVPPATRTRQTLWTTPNLWKTPPGDGPTDPCDCPHQVIRLTPIRTTRRPPGLEPGGLRLVREGGVEPPRPCGHWNLNPARLPIPPPAHWVCPPAPCPCGLAPSDTQNISTLAGVGSHRFPGGSRRPGRSSDPGRRPADVRSPSLRIRECRFSYQPRTGTARLPRSRTGSTVRCGTLVCGRLYDPCQNEFAGGVRRGASEGTSGGNRGGCDTRRRGPRGEPADSPARGYDQ